MKQIIVSLFLLIIIFSCKKDEGDVSTVVINELMAINSYTAMDQNNQFDDWIELYNNSASKVDLSGYFLSDSRSNLSKWKFPAGTVIEANTFLIVWADKDTIQPGLHANFKLSSSGEKLYLSTPDKVIWDKVEYGEQTEELSYGRTPNGTGEFKWQLATFNEKN
jgi:hypothetical protein